MMPIGRHCRRTDVQAQRLPGSVYLLHLSQTNCIVVKRNCTKERVRLLEKDAGRERMSEQDPFVAETEAEIRVGV